MHRVLVLGAGTIGRTIAAFLASTSDYELTVADVRDDVLRRVAESTGAQPISVDARDEDAIDRVTGAHDAVICALAFDLSTAVADSCSRTGASYFDLTEDVASTHHVKALARSARQGQIFMPQCGLAPGFVSVMAYDLACRFDELDSVALRVGALPEFPANPLQYNFTWSPEGVIHEYCEPCEALADGERVLLQPLDGLEELVLDGARYEAFNTSGGLGTLTETLYGRVRELTYKTLRYPGHRDLMKFLLRDLRLERRRDVAQEILVEALPRTEQDIVIAYAAVTGTRGGERARLVDVRRILPAERLGKRWTAIQLATASGACAMVDLHREGALPATGFVRQENVSLRAFLENRFGRVYGSYPAWTPSSGGEAPAWRVA